MEEFGGAWFKGIGNTIRKKRSETIRRPRSESHQFHENCDWSPLSSSLPSDDVSKASSDENTGVGINSVRKELNLNQCTLKGSATNRAGEYTRKIIDDDVLSSLSYGNGGFGDGTDEGGSGLNQKWSSEGVLSPANWKGMSSLKGSFKLQSTNVGIQVGSNDASQSSANSAGNGNGVGNEKRVKKVKLKVGGVTHTIQTKLDSDGVRGSGSSTKSTSDAPQSQHKLFLQDNIDNSALDKNSRMRGIPWKDFSKGSSSPGKEKDTSAGKVLKKITHGNGGEKWEPVRKSKRVPKRRVLDEASDEDDDNEIRYLKKLKLSKVAAGNKHFHEESSVNQQGILMVSKNSKHANTLNNFLSSSVKDGKKKSISERGYEDTDYEEELVPDYELEGKKKKLRKECNDLSIEHKRELALTTRQRALLSSKDPSSVSGASIIEFPNGLPPASHRKQKEKLTEVELQLKKAEAAQRRRLQVEKAARESEAEAIRKILGQDSSRKKREDKIKKRKEELEQAKAANALILAASTIRWVMGPTGTVVTFPNDMGLPGIFNQNRCSYPCPREKCAGPFCTNPYKYRDSKSKLPLCSLQCYKAIHEKVRNETTV